MCICILARHEEISIDYASESVSLEKDGLLTVVVDLLITSKSNNPINELTCILPQVVIPSSNIRIPLRYRNFDCLYNDITEDIVNENSVYNTPTSEGGFSSYVDTVNPARTITEYESSNPHVPSANVKYKGFYYGGNTMIPDPGITPLGHIVLSELKTSILSVQLGEPLVKYEARWFRWRFYTLTGSLEVRDRIMYHYNKLINKLYYSYSIIGPGTVSETFIKILSSYRKAISIYSHSGTNPVIINTIANAIAVHKQLHSYIVNDLLSDPLTQVSIIDWRVRVFNGKLNPFTSIQQEGDVQVSGSQPNFLTYIINGRNVFDPYYSWKAGIIHLSYPGSEKGKFNVRFSTRYEPFIHRALPFFSFIIGLCGLLLAIFTLMFAKGCQH
jgi:hypothetical protein